MTFVTLTDAAGKKFTLGPVQAATANGLELSLGVVDTLPPGKYTVAWRTVASDGHPSNGTFSFIILGAPPSQAQEPPANTAVTPEAASSAIAPAAPPQENTSEANPASVSNSLARAFSFMGLLALVGAVVFRSGVLPRARSVPAEAIVTMQARAALLGVWASVLVVVSASVRIVLEARMIAATMPPGQSLTTTRMIHTSWGFALALQIALALVAAIAFAFAMKKVRAGWLVAALAAVLVAATPALAGHAAATANLTSFVITSDFLHVLGAASWLGSLLCIVVVGLPALLTLEDGQRWQSVASLVNAFSPLALVSAAIVVASGVIASWVHLDHLSDLWTTAYGKVLVLKLVLVATTLVVGAYNFRRVQPQLVTEGGTARLRRSATLELSFAFLVLIVTGFLTGIAP